LQHNGLPIQPGKVRSPEVTKQEWYIFFGVLFYGFLIQLMSKTVYGFGDKNLWTNQIQYLLNHDPRQFGIYSAYGHPGTPLVELGSLFHIVLGFSYDNAATLALSFLIASATAACSVLCSLLYRRSLWWLATAFTLLLSRLYFIATPPTAVAMPLIVLIVFATWFLWEQQDGTPSWRIYVLWGAVVGLAVATRLDISFLVSAPMFMLLWHRHGRKVLLPMLAGAGISFYIMDPYLWFMPIRHLVDLVHKFTVHYAHYSSPTKIEPLELARALSLAAVSVGWSFVLLYRRRLAQIIPVPILVVLIGASILAIMVILSSKIQLVRYLSPLIIAWEVLLPLFAQETFAPTKRSELVDTPPERMVESWWIIGLVVLTQVIAAAFI
jgi:hypothetical protein